LVVHLRLHFKNIELIRILNKSNSTPSPPHSHSHPSEGHSEAGGFHYLQNKKRDSRQIGYINACWRSYNKYHRKASNSLERPADVGP
jgi:hypothetical protein